jgi:hypothetical protein
MRVWAGELIARSPYVAVTFTNLALEVLKPITGDVPIVFIGVVALLYQSPEKIFLANWDKLIGPRALGQFREFRCCMHLAASVARSGARRSLGLRARTQLRRTLCSHIGFYEDTAHWRPACSRDAISPHERYQTSVPEWDRQFRLVRVHHKHREELGRLRLAGIGADAVAVAGQLGEALSGLVGLPVRR